MTVGCSVTGVSGNQKAAPGTTGGALAQGFQAASGRVAGIVATAAVATTAAMTACFAFCEGAGMAWLYGLGGRGGSAAGGGAGTTAVANEITDGDSDEATVVSAATNIASRVPPQFNFVPGQEINTTIVTKAGNVGILAETEAAGSQLIVRNLIIFGSDKADLANKVGAPQWLAARNELARYAASQGFETMRLHGERVANSSSANPGHVIDVVIDLARYL